MLGHELVKVFPNAIRLTHEDLDITKKNIVCSTIKRIYPDIVINAAAFTDVEACEVNPSIAYSVNGYAPGYLADVCREINATFVHYSTNYVFNGTNKDGYNENSMAMPINVYGRSKLLGENNIIMSECDYRIIRTSWLFGKHGTCFITKIMDAASKNNSVKVVNDQFGKPTYAFDLARKTKEALEHQPGIYHITNEGICTWYEFAATIINNAIPCDTSDFPTKVMRPQYSCLNNNKTKPLRHWHNALEAYLNEVIL